MPYTLFITRAAHWSANAAAKIEPAEWNAIVSGDPSLWPPQEEPTAAVRFRSIAGGPASTLAFIDGNIACRNPDEPTVAKLLELAAQLNARVQGEDGEIHHDPISPPTLLQSSFFERPSRRLRVRFPARATQSRFTPPVPQIIDDIPQPPRKLVTMPQPFSGGSTSTASVLASLLNPLVPIATRTAPEEAPASPPELPAKRTDPAVADEWIADALNSAVEEVTEISATATSAQDLAAQATIDTSGAADAFERRVRQRPHLAGLRDSETEPPETAAESKLPTPKVKIQPAVTVQNPGLIHDPAPEIPVRSPRRRARRAPDPIPAVPSPASSDAQTDSAAVPQIAPHPEPAN